MNSEALSVAQEREATISDGGIVRVEPGHLAFTAFEKPPVETPTGLVLAELEKDTYERPAFGIVAACGLYVERNLGSIIFNKPDWPLPAGTLILQMYPQPSHLNLPGNRFYFIRADQVVMHWLPNEWPKWAHEMARWMKKHPSQFESTIISDPDKHRKLLEAHAKSEAEKNKRLVQV